MAARTSWFVSSWVRAAAALCTLHGADGGVGEIHIDGDAAAVDGLVEVPQRQLVTFVIPSRQRLVGRAWLRCRRWRTRRTRPIPSDASGGWRSAALLFLGRGLQKSWISSRPRLSFCLSSASCMISPIFSSAPWRECLIA